MEASYLVLGSHPSVYGCAGDMPFHKLVHIMSKQSIEQEAFQCLRDVRNWKFNSRVVFRRLIFEQMEGNIIYLEPEKIIATYEYVIKLTETEIGEFLI